MKTRDLPEASSRDAGDLLAPLLNAPATPSATTSPPGVTIGELLALADGCMPLVRWPGQPGLAARRARTTVDLQGRHIGREVLLVFEQGSPELPIVIGVLHEQAGWPLEDPPAQVEVDAEGQRLVVTAREQLVFRCGKASITLTKAGKVMIEGSYLSSRSTGVNRIKGGSVQLN